MRRRAFATAFALLLALGAARAAPGTASPPSARKTRATAASASQRGSIGAFFRRLDADGDGEIQTEELSAYVGSSVGGSDFDTEGEILAAVTEATAAIDGVDDGSSIDEEELLAHLTRVTNQLLTPHRVELWVRHGLRFPQYAEAFGANAITALDFPALIADGGAVLREDLGVRSAFHLGKIVRSLKRQILGLGAPPSPPRNVRAARINATAVAVAWDPPSRDGVPPVHAYVVQSRSGDDPEWRVEAVVEDGEDLAYAAAVAPSADARFRVIAWGSHGSSDRSDESEPLEPMDPPPPKPDGFEGRGGALDDAARRGDGVPNNPRAAVGGKDAPGEKAFGDSIRAAGSTVLFAGLVARFLLSSASFVGGPGTVRGLARRGIRWALRRGAGAGAGAGAEAGPSARGGGGGGGGDREVPREDSRARAARTSAGTPPPRDAQKLVDRSPNGSPAGGEPPPPLGGGELGDGAAPSSASIRQRSKSRTFDEAMAAAVAAGVVADSPGAPPRSSSPALASPSPRASSAPPSAPGAEIAADPVVRSEAKKKGRCCAVGCDARWDRWTSTSDFRMRYLKHYCGLCQRAFCAAHTRVSPHGNKGRCDPESKCVCVTCHAALDAATREALEKTNKLPPPPEKANETSAAKARWQIVKNYQLRAADANLPLSPVNSSGRLAG